MHINPSIINTYFLFAGVSKNADYAKNLAKLDKFLLVKFTEDSIVDPKGT